MNGRLSVIRILVADDHPLVRAGLKASLAKHWFLRIVAEASTGTEALAKARELKPHIALMDINMPELGGLAAAKRLHAFLPSCRTIILTMHSGSEYVRQALRAGAKGYLQKDASADEIVRAIQAVHAGKTFFSDEATAALLGQLGPGAGACPDEGIDGLTPREREILALVADGGANKAIAARLGIGVRTVETHRERIMRKLGIRTASGLTKYALAHGLISLD